MQVIIFKQDSGVPAVIIPTQEALSKYSIEQIARKDVPHGKAYAVVDQSEIPTDRSQRDAWVIDDADLTDGIGAVSNNFEE